MCRTCCTYGVTRGTNKVSMGKPGGKRTLGRLRRRREEKIKTDVR
jgi:hypothetical protein